MPQRDGLSKRIRAKTTLEQATESRLLISVLEVLSYFLHPLPAPTLKAPTLKAPTLKDSLYIPPFPPSIPSQHQTSS
ncbi:MAG: hypothetical protein OHK0035_10390 [Cyanobacteria bacterium J069]